MLTSQLNLQTTATVQTQYILGTTAGGNAIINTSWSVLLATVEWRVTSTRYSIAEDRQTSIHHGM